MKINIGYTAVLLGLLVGAGSTVCADEAILFTTDDTAVLGQAPAANHGALTGVRIRYSVPADWGNSYVLAKFDLSTLPENIVVNWVRMRFYTGLDGWPAGGTNFVPVSICNNLGDWDEMVVDYNTRPAFDGVAVETLDHFGLIGIDDVPFTGTNNITAGGWLEYVGPSTRDLVQGWVDGSIPNFGVSVKGSGDYLGNDLRLFLLQAKENPEPSVQPRLIIDYTLAPPPTNGTTEIVLDAIDDAWVNGNVPAADTNYGTNSVMKVRYENETWGKNNSLVKFDFSPLSGQTIHITSAKIRFNVELGSWPGPTNFTEVGIFENTQDWDESTVTWNNAPSYDSSAVETMDHFSSQFGGDEVYFTGTNTITGGGWLEYASSNTTALVEGWLDGSIANHGITISGAGSYVDAFRLMNLQTKENTAVGARPQLVIEYETVGFTTFEDWADSWGIPSDSQTEDYEPDGLDNLQEYAFGGNPTNDDAAAFSPILVVAGDTTTHVYNKLNVSDLTYELFVDWDSDLLTYDWTNAVAAGAGETTGPAGDPAFHTVTNEFTGVGGLDQAFLKLDVSD